MGRWRYFPAGLVNRPDVVLLDEPITGLDLLGQRRHLEMVRALGCPVLHGVGNPAGLVRVALRVRFAALGRVFATRFVYPRPQLTGLTRSQRPRAAGRHGRQPCPGMCSALEPG